MAFSAAQPQKGDFAVTKIPGIAGRAIAAGQWLIGKPSPVQHAYVYVGGGRVVQAMPGGAELVPMADAEPAYAWSTGVIALSAAQRVAIAAAGRDLVGTPYGWLDYLSIALHRWHIRPRWVTNRVLTSNSMICSQLVDYVHEVACVRLFADGRIPGDVVPTDLYRLLAPRGH